VLVVSMRISSEQSSTTSSSALVPVMRAFLPPGYPASRATGVGYPRRRRGAPPRPLVRVAEWQTR
jgi:hypothetical protein